MNQVICFGEILWDCFSDGKKPGGAPMNVALNLRKQGIDSSLISSVGNDDDGRELIDFLKDQNLPVDLIQYHPLLPTGTVKVKLDKKQHASYTIVQPVAWDEIFLTEELIRRVAQADAVVYGTLASRNEISWQCLWQLLPEARLKVFDMNLRAPHLNETAISELLHDCDILKINEDELLYLEDMFHLPPNRMAENLLYLRDMTDTPLIFVTLGDEGAVALYEGRFYRHKGFSITVADTVGAGDAFLAGFLSAYLQKLPMEQVLTRACASGALVASRQGANPAYTIADLEKILAM